jgi:MiaB/RimO family radical SAM methylthiotransferase
MKVFIATMGCSLNKGDSIAIKAKLEENGHIVVEDPVLADALVINTCAVRSDSEQKAFKLISKLRSVNKGAKLIIAGCLSEVNPYSILKQFPRAVLISPYRINEINEALESDGGIFLGFSEGKRSKLPEVLDGPVGIVPINDGCLGDCSFCVTKWARRALLSRPPSAILSAVRNLVNKGAKEIQLASQDAAAYGVDLIGRKVLPDLVKRIDSEIDGRYMLRIAMMNPDTVADILDGVIKTFKLKHVYKFAHIPIQSGSDKVLRIMNRKYGVKDFIKIVEALKSEVPDIRIATDVMVGHPGEDDEDFEGTLRLIKMGLFDRVHIAQYTPRPFTRSARMPQLSDNVKKERSKMILQAQAEIGIEKMKRFVGKSLRGVVVETNIEKRSFTVRTDNYISIVVGNGGKIRLGNEVSVRITGATFFDLRGEIEEVFN